MFTNQMIVASRIDELHATAANERLARSARPADKRVGALTAFRSLLAGADKTQAMPKLTDYPYRS
jgi:hypothetical protein